MLEAVMHREDATRADAFRSRKQKRQEGGRQGKAQDRDRPLPHECSVAFEGSAAAWAIRENEQTRARRLRVRESRRQSTRGAADWSAWSMRLLLDWTSTWRSRSALPRCHEAEPSRRG